MSKITVHVFRVLKNCIFNHVDDLSESLNTCTYGICYVLYSYGCARQCLWDQNVTGGGDRNCFFVLFHNHKFGTCICPTPPLYTLALFR